MTIPQVTGGSAHGPGCINHGKKGTKYPIYTCQHSPEPEHKIKAKITRTVKNNDGSETQYWSDGRYSIVKDNGNGNYSCRSYTSQDKLYYEHMSENGEETTKTYDEFGRIYAYDVENFDSNHNYLGGIYTKYEYYGDSKSVQKTEVYDTKTSETTVTKFAEDGKTPIEKYVQKGAVKTYYDPNNPDKILKVVTDKGTVQEVRVPDENGNLVLQETE